MKRERCPIPTIDEVLQDLNQSKFFSKLDLNSAYHQIELAPESRDNTTFGTHDGLYRYKRLMFGIIQKFGFINGVDNVNWPPYRDSKS